jgi:DNA-binding transcriptional MerR regulator
MLTTEEVSGACGLDPQILREWINNGLIEPAMRGGKGRGRSHRFSDKQAVGIARATVFYLSKWGLSRDGIKSIVSDMEETPDGAMRAWIERVRDPYRQERFAELIAREEDSCIREVFERVHRSHQAAIKMYDAVAPGEAAEAPAPERTMRRKTSRSVERRELAGIVRKQRK